MSDTSDLSSLVKNYEDVLGSLLDKHAPMKQRTISIRPRHHGIMPISQEQKGLVANLKGNGARLNH